VKVRIDETRCQGHGLCSFGAPEVFRLRDDDGHSEVVEITLTPELEDKARRAAEGCPEQAIVIDE
jgi:ferredoxin